MRKNIPPTAKPINLLLFTRFSDKHGITKWLWPAWFLHRPSVFLMLSADGFSQSKGASWVAKQAQDNTQELFLEQPPPWVDPAS